MKKEVLKIMLRMKSIDAEIQAMIVDNDVRFKNNESPAWSSDIFFDCAKEYDNLIEQLENLKD